MQGGLAQNGNGFSDGFDQAIGLLQGIVHREGSPRSCFDAKFLHEWLAAMMTCANGNAFPVQESGQIMRVNAVYGKRQNRCFAGSCAVLDESINFLEAFSGSFQ